MLLQISYANFEKMSFLAQKNIAMHTPTMVPFNQMSLPAYNDTWTLDITNEKLHYFVI